jgi:hypothetical protein
MQRKETDMDREIWTNVMAAVDRAIRAVKPPGRRPTYSHRLVAGMYFWSVWHDRCLSWACDRAHYGDAFRPRKLPSVSRFTRRVREDAMRQILQRVHEDLAARGAPAGPVSYLDGKPLAVGPVSKDPDARRGHVTGGFAKGYKLHAYVTERRRIAAWSVMPLNVAEQTVAAALCPHLPAAPAGALTLADGNYDAAPLHKALAAAGDRRLLTPLKGQARVKADGGGRRAHHPVTLRQMGPARREAVAVDRACPALKRFVLKQRNNVEGVFSVLACACGLAALPAFVRRLGRVTRWVGAKIILYHARLLAQEAARRGLAA